MTEHRTQADIVVAAGPAQIMDTIADLTAYPSWIGEITQGEVLSVHADNGRVEHGRLAMDTGLFTDDHLYVYTWHGNTEVRWSLVRGRKLRALEGVYHLVDNGDGTTRITYALAIEPAIPVIGPIRRQAEKLIVRRALAGLRTYVEAQPRTMALVPG